MGQGTCRYDSSDDDNILLLSRRRVLSGTTNGNWDAGRRRALVFGLIFFFPDLADFLTFARDEGDDALAYNGLARGSHDHCGAFSCRTLYPYYYYYFYYYSVCQLRILGKLV